MVLASAVALAGIAAVAVAVPNASAKQNPDGAVSADALAVASADRATKFGISGLAKGPAETFVRGDVVAGMGGLRYVAYERTYHGLAVVGGDAVVVTDARGKVLSVSSAMSRPL